MTGRKKRPAILICVPWNLPFNVPESVEAACDQCGAAIRVSSKGLTLAAVRLCLDCSATWLADVPDPRGIPVPGDEPLFRAVTGADTLPAALAVEVLRAALRPEQRT